MISRIQFEKQRSGNIVLKEIYIKGCFFNQEGIEKHVNMIAGRYTELKVALWMRIEYFRENFIKAFSNYFTMNQEIISEYMKIKINTSG